MNARTLKHLTELDPIIGQLIRRAGPMKLKPRRLTPYQSLVSAVVYQQLSGKAAATILGRFKAMFEPDEFPDPAKVAATDVEKLRSAGLSRNKAAYIREIAIRTLEGKVPTLEECDRLEDEQIIEQLTEIKGVGRWTVEMFLIFNLCRPDVLPAHDLGVRKGFQIAYKKRKMPHPKKLMEFGEAWRPYRTTAAWYMWRAVDTP